MRPGRRAPALLLLVVTACGGDPPASDEPGAANAPSTSAGVTVTWKDDQDLATGAAMHRMGAEITAPRSDKARMRAIARDALVTRALELGFVRLDDLQIETSCDEAAPDATACTARIMAIASR